MRGPSVPIFLLTGAILLGVFMSGWVTAQAPTAAYGIHIAWGADPSTQATVSWAGPAAAVARVDYGPTTSYSSTAAATAVPVGGDNALAYRGGLNGLTPDTIYHYRVAMDAAVSADFTFRTGPALTAPFKVAAWGDHGVPDQRNPAGGSPAPGPGRTLELARDLGADFILLAGDIAYANGFNPTWDAYFAAGESTYASTPLMTAVGNHEREAGQGFAQYDARLPMPVGEAGRWYSFRYGEVLFVSLDTEHACTQTAAFDRSSGVVAANCDTGADATQLMFLDDTLRTARSDPKVEWIVAFHHYTLWSDGSHGSDTGVRAIWAPLYEKYRVDLVVQGHDHLYERSHQMTGTTPTPGGVTYVTVGTGGASLYEFQSGERSPPSWEAARAREFGLLLLSFANDSLESSFVNHAGETKDRFYLVHAEDGNPRLVAEKPTAPTGSDNATGTDSARRTPGPDALAIVLAGALVVLASRRRSV